MLPEKEKNKLCLPKFLQENLNTSILFKVNRFNVFSTEWFQKQAKLNILSKKFEEIIVIIIIIIIIICQDTLAYMLIGGIK